MNREELESAVQELVGRCLALESECHQMEEVSAAENLATARSFIVAAANRLMGPMPWERPMPDGG